MSEQLDIFGDPLERAFRAFHRRNPEVYVRLRELSLGLRRRGRERYGIKGLWEVMRWHAAMETDDPEWKLNNNYHALYARLLMDQEPELVGFFETRERR